MIFLSLPSYRYRVILMEYSLLCCYHHRIIVIVLSLPRYCVFLIELFHRVIMIVLSLPRYCYRVIVIELSSPSVPQALR